MTELKDIKELVRKALKEREETRDSDFRLVCWVYYDISPDLMRMPFARVMWNHAELGLPSFETIRRARQKLQHDFPELRGKAYSKRMEKQSEYIDAFTGWGDV